MGKFFKNQSDDIYNYIALSTGTGKDDEGKIKTLFGKFPLIEFICVDVANGYSEHFVDLLKKYVTIFPLKQ